MNALMVELQKHLTKGDSIQVQTINKRKQIIEGKFVGFVENSYNKAAIKLKSEKRVGLRRRDRKSVV